MQIFEAKPEPPSGQTHPGISVPPVLRQRRWIMGLVAAAALALLLTGWYLADHYWPYRYRKVKPTLESILASQVTITAYHRTYFP